MNDPGGICCLREECSYRGDGPWNFSVLDIVSKNCLQVIHVGCFFVIFSDKKPGERRKQYQKQKKSVDQIQ